MRPALFFCLPFLLCAQPGEYQLGPDSKPQPGVPKGTVTKHTWSSSRIFPGTTRDYWTYVPAQYDSAKPTPVMIFQDGGGYVSEKGPWFAHIVLDNLIHRREIPAMIGIFVNPGVVPALDPNTQQPRFNRSFEYDALGDRYARFLLEEILPEVGQRYNLSKNPDDRAIAGSSSGGSAAFTAAWTRPNEFHRVMSFIGSFVNLRGAEAYPTLLRKTEPRPLRIFLQDGERDNNIYAGNWWIANQDMASSLDFMGYDYTFIKGTEAHNSRHGAAILPEAMRWLWRGYPEPIRRASKDSDARGTSGIIDPAKGWELVSQGHRFTEGPAVDRSGNVFFTDVTGDQLWRIDHATGRATLWKDKAGRVSGLMFNAAGQLIAVRRAPKQIVAIAPDGSETVLAEGVDTNDLAVAANGNIYFSDPPGKKVWLLDPQRRLRVVHEGLEFPNGVALSPDQALLTVADSRSKWVWSFQIQPDGTLAHGQPYYRLETLDLSSASSADGMKTDADGYLYVATSLGIQVCDQPGRVTAILDKPQAGPLSNLVFGGPQLDTLYVTAGDKVYRRPVKRRGTWPWTPVKPPQPRL